MKRGNQADCGIGVKQELGTEGGDRLRAHTAVGFLFWVPISFVIFSGNVCASDQC